MEQRRRKVPVFLRQAIRQGIGVCIAVTLGYAIMGMLGGARSHDSLLPRLCFGRLAPASYSQILWADCFEMACRETEENRSAVAAGERLP